MSVLIRSVFNLFSAPAEGAPHGEHDNERLVCAENIGAAERRKRLGFGAFGLIVSLAIAAALMAAGVDRWWRLILFFPFAAAAIGFFQAYEKT